MLAFEGESPLSVPTRTLFLGAQAHPTMTQWPEVLGWQPLKPLAQIWENHGFPLSIILPAGTWPVVLMLPGKSRDETLAGFALARQRLEPGGTMVIALPNTAGAVRFEKALASATGKITSLQKNKCRVFYATDDGHWNEDLFEQWLALSRMQPIPQSHFLTQPGVFSCDHIDPGSLLLAAHLPPNLRGNVADLGSGWGFLSDAALRRCPKISRLDMFEADVRAVACACANLSVHDTDKLVYHWHDVTTGLPSTYDAIVMNPPFHTGQAADIDLGRTFILTAAASLKRGGKLCLVANRQLPYEAVLDASGLRWRLIAQDPTYKVIFADKR
jgi:16S rRNA (guanine1207-N2)-methyltransferase